MKKNNKHNRVDSFLSNNPMLDVEAKIDMPIIDAQAYDVPLPYCDTTKHMRERCRPQAKRDDSVKS